MISALQNARLLARVGERNPDIGQPWKAHRIRHDPDDLARNSVQHDFLAKDFRGRTKLRLPHPLTNQSYGRGPGNVV